MDFKECIPTGDKVVLEVVQQSELSPGGIIMPGGAESTQARVVAVGRGMPYGRGEFYEPVAKPGMLALIPSSVWGEAARFKDSEGREVRVLHEREISLLFEA